MFPECEFLLADSIGKKIKVVQEVAAAIGLQNITAMHTRAEELKGKRTFDFAVSRAVAPLSDLWRWGGPLIDRGQKSDELPNGLVCLKGGDLREEINQTGLKRIIQAWSVHDIFPEPSFEEKFVVYIPKLN
jgi:16S rRNA (guanine527-N7)-methyltransferase